MFNHIHTNEFFSGCYSASEEAKCLEDHTYFNRTCILSDDLCDEFDLGYALNRTFCYNNVTSVVTPINSVINRTLATSEYFR